MFQTEFCGPDHKLLISWDTGNRQNYSFEDDILNDQDIFYKLNELYRNISKFSTEFVDCVKSVHSPSNLEQLQNHLHENNPNVTVKIENFSNKESYSDELFLLRQQVEKLKEEKEQMILEHKNEIAQVQNDCETQTNKLIEEQERKLDSVKQELENKYNLEMSDLRRYFENKCTESLRQFTEESYQCSKDSDSDSYSDIEPDDENYEAITSTKYAESNIDHATKGLQKILDKDLKNIRKAYIIEVDKLKEDLTKKKDEEIREFKRALESKYISKFETLQSQLDLLLSDKNLNDTVNSIHSQVKKDYEAELDDLQNLSDLKFASRIQNEFILTQEELDKRDEEWKNNLESSISDFVVDSALKAVIKETHQKSQSCHCSPSKKYKYKEIKQLKQKYKQEMEDLRRQYENDIKSTISKFEHQIQQLSDENDQLINQNKDLLQLNQKYIDEIESLKQKTIENLQTLRSTQEKEIVERIKDEISKMKECYETEMSTMRDSKYALEKACDELQSELFNVQNTRKNVISSLQAELEDLISKERNGQQVDWPEELKVFRQFCTVEDTVRSRTEVQQLQVPVSNSRDPLDMSNEDGFEDDFSDLEAILRQRNTLRKVILTLYSACEGFRRYITGLDEDRNTTLTNELTKIGLLPCKVSADMTLDDVIRSLDETEKENLKKINLAPNMSEVMNLFGGEEDLPNLTLDCNKSFNHSELSIWFEKLKNDAAAILCLTSGKKVDIDTINVDAETQTDINGQQYDRIQGIIEELHQEIVRYQEQYAKAQNEVDRLTEKISAFESLEAYGEGISGVAIFNDELNKPKEQLTFSRQEEFCSDCDKVREEAKRDKEDLRSQLEAASKKHKSFELFLERETAEREAEREEFDKQVQLLQNLLKEKERELCSLNNHVIELNAMELQLKDLTNDYEATKIHNQRLESELNAATEKVCTLRERNQDLEAKLAQKSELAENAEVKLKEKVDELLLLQQEYQSIRHELDSYQDNGCKQLDLLREQHEISAALINQMKTRLLEVEKTVLSRTRELENNYVAVTSSNVVSSPSEDVSICDRIADRVRLLSPSRSDTSSSPVHLPVDLLLCLNEKLQKLFRAEDAAFKRIQDQDMQINKMSMLIDELHLEKDTIQEKLTETADKLAEARMELENWQYRSNSAQSETATKLKKTIQSLQSQLDGYEKQITQKETKLKESRAKIAHLENYIKTSETEFTEKLRDVESANEDLKRELRDSTNEINKLNELLSGHRREENLSLSTVVEKLLDEKNQQIHQLEDKLDVLKSLAEIGDKSHSTEIDSKTSSKFKGNLTETLESFVDASVSDHTRNAVSDLSISPRYISISSSVKRPLLGSGTGNESTCSLQPIEEVDEKVYRSETGLPVLAADQKGITFRDDSIVVNLDDVSWNQAGERDTDRTILSVPDPDTVGDQVAVYKNQLEDEKRNHFATLIQLRELNSRWEAEKKEMKETEALSAEHKQTVEKRLRDLEWEHVSCKEQCYKYEQQVLLVTKDLENAQQTVQTLTKQLEQIDDLRDKLAQMETLYKREQDQCKSKDQRVAELSTILEAEKNKTRELNENYEKWFKAVVKERVEAQVKCEEYAHNFNALAKELEAEKSKCEKLALLVESFDHKKNQHVEEANNRVKSQADEITELKNTVARLQADVEQAQCHARQMELENDHLKESDRQMVVQSNDINSLNSTLKDLTQKVQKQVDLAALLDENMLQSLEFDSKTESFLEELNKLSPLPEELRQILVKILQYGFEVLEAQEKNVLRNAYDMFDGTHLNQIETLKNSVINLSDLVEQLQLATETERRNNKDLADKNYKLQLEMNRTETVHRYFEERISFLITKLDEYRTKAVKTEIELTTEKTTRRQVEFSFERYKKQIAEKQSYDAKKLEEIVDQLNATTDENLKLKQETEVLRNRVDSLIAELNSVKAITQYHSDSESELSRSLNPLKERLTELEDKYARMKHEYEKKKMELRHIKSNLNLERHSVKKLESVLKEVSSEKHKIEKQLVDSKGTLDDLMWQKQKLEDKLKAAELAELKRRKMQSVKDDVVKKEYECSQEFQRKLERECDEFQKNVIKLANELVAFKNNCKQVTQEAQRIFLRMLRAESSQRSLVYQKNYLVVTLHEYENKCDAVVRSITSGTKSFSNFVANGISLKQKFRSYAFCIISMHRMQVLISRRTNNNYTKMKHYFVTHIPELAARSDEYFDLASLKKLSHGESKKPDTADAEDLLLQNICQHYARLREIYVADKPTDRAS